MMQSVIIADDAEIIDRLLDLHQAGESVLDLTYGHGRFWARRPNDQQGRRITGIDQRHPRELENSADRYRPLIRATLSHLPFQRQSFHAIVCDPPFLIGSNGGGTIADRYTSPPTYQALLDLMANAATEARRVIRPHGVAIIKAMDTTDGRRRRWFHSDVKSLWEQHGWRQDDLIVKIGVTNMRNPGWTNQARSKAAHTFFLVFKTTRTPPRPGPSDA
ncbi:MAG: hypothetical protein V3S68_09825 [Dehalococcoidia bacterium]